MVKKNNKDTRDSIKTTIHMRETLNNMQPSNQNASSILVDQSYQQMEPQGSNEM